MPGLFYGSNSGAGFESSERLTREVFGSVVSAEYVVFDAYAAERSELVDAFPADVFVGRPAARGLEQQFDEIESGFDRDDESRLEASSQPQGRVTLRAWDLGPCRVASKPGDIVYLQPQQVTDAVWKEDSRDPSLNRSRGIAIDDTGVSQHLCNQPVRLEVDVSIVGARANHLAELLLDRVHPFDESGKIAVAS